MKSLESLLVTQFSSGLDRIRINHLGERGGGPINVLGPVGVGKTTICQALTFKLGNSSKVLTSATADDLESRFAKYLIRFVESPHRNAFSLQMEALIQRFFKMLQASENDVLDEGFPSDLVFSRIYLRAGYMTQIEYETYFSLFCTLKLLLPIPRLTVFLDAPPEVLMQRIDQRGRDVDQKYEINYIRSLRQGYIDLFEELTSDYGKLLMVDTNTKSIDDIIAEILLQASYGQTKKAANDVK